MKITEHGGTENYPHRNTDECRCLQPYVQKHFSFKTFEKYCKEVWDLSKMHARRQVRAYEAVSLLESKSNQLFTFSVNKKSAIADKNESSTDELLAELGDKCISCEHRKAMANRAFKGVRTREGPRGPKKISLWVSGLSLARKDLQP